MATQDDIRNGTAFPRFAALTALPAGYRVVHRLEIESTRTLLLLNLYGLGLLIVGYLLFAWYGVLLDTQPGAGEGFNPLANAHGFIILLLGIAAFFLMLTVHELFHGLAYSLFGAKVRYGVNLSKGVAYASADNHYLTRDAYIVVGLAPLVMISILSVVLMALTGGELRALIGLMGAANVGGAVGDLWFVLTCRRYPRTMLVRDFGDGAELLMPHDESGTITAH